ncbi:hypothetical protein VHEMI01156 [[Torrubiella] hemipterigena]|uniref:CP-type G domain-containing protein n=1 Tax=[Torrubiella] hemipterigena TaxID=1531966 RepID=A0A0A1SSB9_9HYPO|nr:hypothetical protein VHEMI01156 [[Torrubiella] hemipterigena]
MVLAKSKKSVGLGNTLMNDRFGKGKGQDRKKAVTRTHHETGEQYLINEKQDAAWVKMRSVTEQGALDEFLSTAELAGTDFTAEKMNNVKIIHTDQKNPYLLSFQEEQAIIGKHKMHKDRLAVPRRPKWDATTTAEQLDMREREAFMAWRRSLAELQEDNDLLMTPFERNLEVWRQLWRVIERSDLIVQIVDARNPLLFRSADLDSYVKELDPKKENLLLINKADMMTTKQRRAWADYLKKAGIAFKFFSAQIAKEMNEARDREEEEAAQQDAFQPPPSQKKKGKKAKQQVSDEYDSEEDEEEEDESEDDSEPEESGGAELTRDDTEILTVEELEGIFLRQVPRGGSSEKLQVGLVGYPNVGKSSTINALIGATKVSVSSTPGKTKHFQTIHLSERVILCDCPGLVFPNFATTKADLVCNGVLPIDQMREHTGPVGLVAARIPQRFLEAIYGIQIKVRPLEEGGTGTPTAEEVLRAYANARGYKTQGLGQPDQARAARYILKDYVNGKLLYVAPPPGIEDTNGFNVELYDSAHLPEKRRLALENLTLAENEAGASASASTDFIPLPTGPKSAKSAKLDKTFFTPKNVAGHVSRPFNYKYTQQGQIDAAAEAAVASEGGRLLTGRKARTVRAIENGIDPKDAAVVSSKKHFKGNSTHGKSKKLNRAKVDLHED